MPQLINWGLVKEPLNWIILPLLCVFFLVFLSFVFPMRADG